MFWKRKPVIKRSDLLEKLKSGDFELIKMPKEFWKDQEVVLAAVKQNGKSLQCASKDLQADREVVLAAVTEFKHALDYASKDLQADPLLLYLVSLGIATEKLYVAVYEEVENKNYDKEMFGQALKEAKGKIDEAKNIYIERRVAQFRRD